MKITKEKIKKFKPCAEGYQWYLDHGSPDLLETLLDVNDVDSDWATWLYTRLMTPKQCQQFGIYAAEEVLHIFEEKYPKDKRPRLAIAAAKKALKSNTKANRNAAYVYSSAAGVAADVVRPTSYCAFAAASAAYAVARAADADRAYAAYSAVATVLAAGDAAYYAAEAISTACGARYVAATDHISSIAMRKKLIRKAVKILEKK